jgi:Spy/CpxP family protein refolding chaperone
VYRRTQGVRALEAAWAMSDLTDEQKLKIDDIRTTFNSAADKANQNLQTQRDRMEEALTPAKLAEQGMRALDDEEMRTAMRARRELDQGVLAQLKDLLTPEQYEKLPKPDADEEGGNRRQRRGGGGGNAGGGDL